MKRIGFVFVPPFRDSEFRYGIWPTRVSISRVILDNLRQDLFSPEGFAKLEEKLLFIAEDKGFLVEDEKGRRYDYNLEGFPGEKDSHSSLHPG